MNWQKSEMQEAITELAGKILTTSDSPWEDLGEAGLLELDDLLDITTLLIEVGKAGAKVPALETLILGGPLQGMDPAPAKGAVLTAGLTGVDPTHPGRSPVELRDGRLSGQVHCVPSASQAEWIAVPAGGQIYGARLADCQRTPQMGTADDPLAIVTFEATPATHLGDEQALAQWLARVDIGVSALLLGLAQRALALTAAYTCERKQFERPIGSFQAVKHRAADAWIDAQVMEVSLWQAAWRVWAGEPSARERAIARYWASEGAHRITAAAQHLHGGFGFDRDYELHRYFLCTKQWEFFLGGANTQLENLGALLAAS